MFGVSGAIKAIVILIIVLVIGGGTWYGISYITGLRANLAVSEENNKKLEDGINSQNQLIEQMQADIESVQQINKQLEVENKQFKKDVDVLNKKFSSDIGKKAIADPKDIEFKVNRGTVNALRCFELASGAPLTNAEKSATTPIEANRECPSLIDPNYVPATQ
jgi:regulator of replication initiation timing